MAATKNRNRHPKNPSFLPGFLGSLFGTPINNCQNSSGKLSTNGRSGLVPLLGPNRNVPPIALESTQHLGVHWNFWWGRKGAHFANFSGNVVPTFSYKNILCGLVNWCSFFGGFKLCYVLLNPSTLLRLLKENESCPKVQDVLSGFVSWCTTQ